KVCHCRRRSAHLESPGVRRWYVPGLAIRSFGRHWSRRCLTRLFQLEWRKAECSSLSAARPVANSYSSIVDASGLVQDPAGIGRNQIVKVLHAPGPAPDEGVVEDITGVARHGRLPDDERCFRVERQRFADIVAEVA